MQQLISSELDADRIDYLKRDSYFTGATYGTIDSKLLDRWIVLIPNLNKLGMRKSNYDDREFINRTLPHV